MENQKTYTQVIVLVVLVILAIVTISVFKRSNPQTPPVVVIDIDEPVACTMEARMCPDGSYVGRQGPNCEFSACPAPTGTSSPLISVPGAATTTVSVKMFQKVATPTVTFTPSEVLEDSRCPIDVQCIQAGTIRLKAQVTGGIGGSKDIEFKLGEKVALENGSVEITLTAAEPAPRASQEILADNYVFTFVVITKN